MLSAAERSHPTSEVRGRSREDPKPEGRQPRGVTPRLRSGAAAESTILRQRKNGREELPHAPTPEARGGGGRTKRILWSQVWSPMPGTRERRGWLPAGACKPVLGRAE